MANAKIQALIQRAIDRTGYKQDVAAAMGITASRLSKLINQDRGDEAPAVANCFRLADYLGESPDVVLRAANHADVVDFIHRHYGAARPTPATPPADPLVEAVAAIVATGEPEDVAAIRSTVGMISRAQQATRSRPARGRAGRRQA